MSAHLLSMRNTAPFPLKRFPVKWSSSFCSTSGVTGQSVASPLIPQMFRFQLSMLHSFWVTSLKTTLQSLRLSGNMGFPCDDKTKLCLEMEEFAQKPLNQEVLSLTIVFFKNFELSSNSLCDLAFIFECNIYGLCSFTKCFLFLRILCTNSEDGTQFSSLFLCFRLNYVPL